jgi:Ino eighty subunit 2
MRRAEMARRRKNLSEKRNEEEKMDTINRLLKKQAPKRRGKISAAEIAANAAGTGRGARGSGLKNGVAMSRAEGGSRTGEEGTPMEDEMEVEKANPVFVRWVSGRDGIKLGVPMEWEGVGAGAVFGSRGWTRPVEEVEG